MDRILADSTLVTVGFGVEPVGRVGVL